MPATTDARELFGLTNRVDEVVQRLREQIVGGKLAAGESLPSEGDLATTLRVSRTVIREAMRILCTQGLVEISQGRRPRVKSADPQAAIISLDALLSRGSGSLQHLTEVRQPLEIEIAGLAAERASDVQLQAISATNEQLAAAATLEECIEADINFHRALAAATNNPLFVLLLETVAQLLRESRRRTLTQSGTKLALEEHLRIFETIKARDPVAARAAMRQHIRLIERDLAAGQTPKLP
ncbi:HTH-type transcriptional regulator LutR [Anatilimnocola aggregata]|uniref:HTH-type transcriptional regulator LutR n=1 Tax=Anatilimnocola aggregata TaxID=2528021 RepID=A0A517YGR7_9BACT|nr:FadR/GntR family transcriptional regulator [Anatilimnocola aggregata]QDU29392.1 HTH-type transcriptional regulator LutR [Anatilimnocola aggregata]